MFHGIYSLKREWEGGVVGLQERGGVLFSLRSFRIFASQHKMISVWPSFLVTSKVLYVYGLNKFSSHLKSLKLRKTSK